MNDSNNQQLNINTDRSMSIEAVQATKPGQPSEALSPTTSVNRRKGWHFVSLIVLLPLGAIGVILYLLRSAFAEEFEGIGAALCVVACGGFLVLHVIHLLADQDKLQEQQLNSNRATASPSQPSPLGPHTNLTVPSQEAGEKNLRTPATPAKPEA